MQGFNPQLNQIPCELLTWIPFLFINSLYAQCFWKEGLYATLYARLHPFFFLAITYVSGYYLGMCDISHLFGDSGLHWGMVATLYATQRTDGTNRCGQAWPSFHFKCLQATTCWIQGLAYDWIHIIQGKEMEINDKIIS